MLQRGDKGEAVGAWQRALLDWNAASLPQYKDDNSFGPETVEWTNKFKLFASLDVNGIVDSLTWGVMQDYLRENQSGITQAEYDKVMAELQQTSNELAGAEGVVKDQKFDLEGTAIAWKTFESISKKYGATV